jgi:hypothetical protein
MLGPERITEAQNTEDYACTTCSTTASPHACTSYKLKRIKEMHILIHDRGGMRKEREASRGNLIKGSGRHKPGQHQRHSPTLMQAGKQDNPKVTKREQTQVHWEGANDHCEGYRCTVPAGPSTQLWNPGGGAITSTSRQVVATLSEESTLKQLHTLAVQTTMRDEH